MRKKTPPTCTICGQPIYNKTARATIHRGTCTLEKSRRWHRIRRLNKTLCPVCKKSGKIKIMPNGAMCTGCGWILSKWSGENHRELMPMRKNEEKRNG